MPVILAQLGGWFALGFLVISFIGWIINLINSQNPPPAPDRGRQRRPQARDRKVQNEIEDFLEEAMGKQRGGPEQVRPDEIEVLEPAASTARRAPSRPRRRPPSRPGSGPKQTPPASQPPRQRRPGSGVASRHVLPSQELGSNVTSHLQEHMGRRVAQETEQHLPHSVDRTVAQHLGDFTADDRDTRDTVKPVHRSRVNISNPAGLIDELRSPAGMRKAILLQEILSKPRMLRK